MKIIKAPVTVEEWNKERVCEHCDAVLEVDAYDLRVDRTSFSEDFAYESRCPICCNKLYFTLEEVPKTVRLLVDKVDKNSQR